MIDVKSVSSQECPLRITTLSLIPLAVKTLTSISSQIVARDMTLAREQIQVAADSLLRDQGYPQSLLYILRAGGLSTEQIRALPTPSFDENTGEITHDYFLIIRDYFGVDEEMLPSRYHSTSPVRKPGNHLASDPRKWTRDEGVQYFGSGEASSFSRPRSAPPLSQQSMHMHSHFGSPVITPLRRLTYDMPTTPPTTIDGRNLMRANNAARAFTPINRAGRPGHTQPATPPGQGTPRHNMASPADPNAKHSAFVTIWVQVVTLDVPD